MKRPVQLGIASLKALATVVAFGAAAHAALPYLPLIGPPPLRIQTVKRHAAPVVKFAPTSALAATNPPAAASATNANGTGSLVTYGPEFGPGTNKSLGGAFSSSVFELPTPDLVGISPQALAAYFRPIAQGTNFVTPIGLMPVSFVPPVPPDKSSHAEYNVK
jgi:hypothetical protein